MAWSETLNIVIVLAFIYLVMAVIASAIVERGATIVSWRARTLKSGLAELLNDPNMQSLAARVYNHPLVASQPSGAQGPSYIDAKVFALALTDVVNGSGGFEGSPLKPAVAALVRASGYNPAAFQMAAESWFDSAMERLSGVYKRRVHTFLFLSTFLIAGLCNVDSIQITRSLAGMSSEARDSLITTLVKLPEQPQELPGTSMSLASGLEKLGGVTNLFPYTKPNDAGGWLSKLIGWMITALAASLGSHFWFNLLEDSLRLTGVKPLPTRGSGAT
jgi:hypothetical protein